MENFIFWFDDRQATTVSRVGGKNASLAEMIQSLSAAGISVPMGFATSTDMYRQFLADNNLEPLIKKALLDLEQGAQTLQQAGQYIRQQILEAAWPAQLSQAIVDAYAEFQQKSGVDSPAVAVRSSATAEDLPDASFAGQQESYLNIQGAQALLEACRKCFASLFTDRAITYRDNNDFEHMSVALSIGVQLMVRSDQGSSGVMFTLDTETGFNKVITINGVWGLGENMVQGTVDPDEFCVFKPLLEQEDLTPILSRQLGSKTLKMIYGNDAGQDPTINIPTTEAEQHSFTLDTAEIIKLSRWAVKIEQHYGRPMDIEWARDGNSGELFIVQARPETVRSRQQSTSLNSYRILSRTNKLLDGMAIGHGIVTGPVCCIEDINQMDSFIDESILVTETTDPDWVPLMKRAKAIITNHGGRTSHAAIVSRELGLPAILGTGNATTILSDMQVVTVSCSEGDRGFVYEGEVEYSVTAMQLDQIPDTRTRVMLTLANPATAFQWWPLPIDGIGLVRMEFVINNHVRVHPLALLQFDAVIDSSTRQQIEELTSIYPEKQDYFIDTLAHGLARFAAVAHPNPVIIRMSDFKTNEYAHLLGGEQFEPAEENPMLGFRGASRYYSNFYQQAFGLECQAIHKIRNEMGFRNVIVMIPFCRTVEEAENVLETMAEFGLQRGQDGLEVYMMCEIPSNVILARDFAQLFDGFSIGSNDLTQLTLGIDRDSSSLASLFSERNPAVLWMIEKAIEEAHAAGIKIGLCGQAPSDHPDFADFLVSKGIDSVSVTPDSFIEVKQHVAKAENVQQ